MLKSVVYISLVFIVMFLFPKESKACDVGVDGPLVVCDGDINTYTITGLPPGSVTSIALTSGAFGTFLFDGNNTITIQWLSVIPNGEFCINYSAPCGSGTYCVEVLVLGSLPSFSLNGPNSVCAEETSIYTISPQITNGFDVDYSVQNGTILSSNSGSVTIQWGSTSADGEVCALITNPCDNTVLTVCMDVEIKLEPTPPDLSSIPNSICLEETRTIVVLPDDFEFYSWDVNFAQLQSTSNTNEIDVFFNQEGTVEICVTVGQGCNNDVQTCKTATVSPPPDPILSYESNCSLEALLIAGDVRLGSLIEWEMIS